LAAGTGRPVHIDDADVLAQTGSAVDSAARQGQVETACGQEGWMIADLESRLLLVLTKVRRSHRPSNDGRKAYPEKGSFSGLHLYKCLAAELFDTNISKLMS